LCCRSGRVHVSWGTPAAHITSAHVRVYTCTRVYHARTRAHKQRGNFNSVAFTDIHTRPVHPLIAQTRECAHRTLCAHRARACAACVQAFLTVIILLASTRYANEAATMTGNSGVAEMGIRRTLIMLCGAHAHTKKQSSPVAPPIGTAFASAARVCANVTHLNASVITHYVFLSTHVRTRRL
jgi:hypothetical protein